MTAKYYRHLHSTRWAKKREQRMAKDGNCCRTCGISGEKVKLHVHHSSYQWLGRERMRDLITLCDDCHRAITAVIRNRRKNKEAAVA